MRRFSSQACWLLSGLTTETRTNGAFRGPTISCCPSKCIWKRTVFLGARLAPYSANTSGRPLLSNWRVANPRLRNAASSHAAFFWMSAGTIETFGRERNSRYSGKLARAAAAIAASSRPGGRAADASAARAAGPFPRTRSRARRLDALVGCYSADQLVVLVVGPDPEPHNVAPRLNPQRSIVQPDAGGPQPANSLELQRSMRTVGLEQSKRSIGQRADFLR